nr:poly-gamma-glutamate hydrolase family protein [Bacillus amyloliquefaciens]
MLKYKNKIEEKEVKGVEKASFDGPNLLHLTLRKVTKLYKYITDKKSFPVLVATLVSFLNPVSILAAEKYRNFEELKANESPFNFSVFSKEQDTGVLILAPHGGGIEGEQASLQRN